MSTKAGRSLVRSSVLNLLVEERASMSSRTGECSSQRRYDCFAARGPIGARIADAVCSGVIATRAAGGGGGVNLNTSGIGLYRIARLRAEADDG